LRKEAEQLGNDDYLWDEEEEEEGGEGDVEGEEL